MADLVIKIVKSTSTHHGTNYATSLPPPPRPTPEGSDRSDSTAVANIGDQSLEQSHVSESVARDIFRLRPMPSSFDAGDVVNRKANVAQGPTVAQLLDPDQGRPRLMRNASEMTTLEITAGYLNRASVISAEK